MSSAAEKFHASNTLSFVVGLCVGKVTTVELKNDCFVTGRVTEVCGPDFVLIVLAYHLDFIMRKVDGYMNVHLREAVHVDATGASRDLSDYYVPNRLIRWVQIPTEIDIKESIKSKFGEVSSSPNRVALNGHFYNQLSMTNPYLEF